MRAISAGAGVRARIEGELELAVLAGDHADLRPVQRRRLALEVDEQPPLGQRAGAQRLERAVGQDPPRPDHDHPLGQRLDVVHVVGGEDDGDAVVAVQASDELAHRQLRGRVEADGRLVEEEQRRLDAAAPRRSRSASAGRATAGAPAGSSSRSSRSSATSSSRIARIALLRHPVDVAQQVEAVDHRQVPPELAALAEHHADARHVAHPLAPGRQAVHLAAAGGRLQDAGEDLDGGRLAGAVRPDQADQLAALQLERDRRSAPRPCASGGGRARAARPSPRRRARRCDRSSTAPRRGSGAWRWPPAFRKGRGT